MQVLVRRIVAPFTALAALWLVASLVIGSATEALFGSYVAERQGPYANAHLLEEALEGTYSPLIDPVFLVYIAVLSGIFAGAAFFAARGASRAHLLYACVPSLVAIALLAWLLRFVWAAGYPSTVRLAAVLQLSSYAIASLAGSYFATARRASPSARVGG